MYFTTTGRWSHAFVWCFWFAVLLTMTWHGGPPAAALGLCGGGTGGEPLWLCWSS